MKAKDHGPAIFHFIVDFHNRNHMAPTVREIMAALAIPSSSTVKHHLTKLEGLGLLTHNPGEARSWRPIKDMTAIQLPQNAATDLMRTDIRRLLTLVEAMLPGSEKNIRETWTEARTIVTELRHEYGP